MRKTLVVSLFALCAGTASASVDVYYSGLYGANECNGAGVCNLGDPDGYGAATVMIDNVTNRVTWSAIAFNIAPVTAAHIHTAPAGIAGPVIVGFAPPLSGNVINPAAAAITPATAADHYVNLHNAPFPGGAIRGQLNPVTTVNAPPGGFVAPAASSAVGAIDIYLAALYGINEVGAGDPDGWGVAMLMIDNLSNLVTWSIVAYDIGLLTGAHIHEAPAGVNGPIQVDFSAMLAGSVADPDAAGITPGNAAGWYVNLHTAAFPGGAIRGQLMHVASVARSLTVPEPASHGLVLAALGAIVFAARRRRIPT